MQDYSYDTILIFSYTTNLSIPGLTNRTAVVFGLVFAFQPEFCLSKQSTYCATVGQSDWTRSFLATNSKQKSPTPTGLLSFVALGPNIMTNDI